MCAGSASNVRRFSSPLSRSSRSARFRSVMSTSAVRNSMGGDLSVAWATEITCTVTGGWLPAQQLDFDGRLGLAAAQPAQVAEKTAPVRLRDARQQRAANQGGARVAQQFGGGEVKGADEAAVVQRQVADGGEIVEFDEALAGGLDLALGLAEGVSAPACPGGRRVAGAAVPLPPPSSARVAWRALGDFFKCFMAGWKGLYELHRLNELHKLHESHVTHVSHVTHLTYVTHLTHATDDAPASLHSTLQPCHLPAPHAAGTSSITSKRELVVVAVVGQPLRVHPEPAQTQPPERVVQLEVRHARLVRQDFLQQRVQPGNVPLPAGQII